MTDDKRRDPRVPTTQSIWCEGQGERALARNVSRQGMMVTVPEPREIGEQFKVKFDGDEGTIEVNMEVMWKEEAGTGEMTGMGLRIVGFDKGEDAYQRFVQKQIEEHASGRATQRRASKPIIPATSVEEPRGSVPPKPSPSRIPAR